MPIPRALKFWTLLLVASVAASWAALADEAQWRSKPIEQWSREDAKEVLADSPWVKRPTEDREGFESGRAQSQRGHASGHGEGSRA
jgi:hypothetical protein